MGFRFPVLLMDEKKDGDGGGGGNAPDLSALSKDLAAAKEQNAALMARLDALEGKKKDAPPPSDDPDLKEKARRDAEAKSKSMDDQRLLESSLKFNMGISEWLKTNGPLVPSDVPGIFATAEKEKYDSEVDKTKSIKSALIQSFFGVQSNRQQLTPAQQTKLDEYLNLTVKLKHERAPEFYDSIFEPTLENLRKVRKAEALNKGYSGDSDDALKEKMRKAGLRHYNVKEKNANA